MFLYQQTTDINFSSSDFQKKYIVSGCYLLLYHVMNVTICQPNDFNVTAMLC